jgi:hypothetical protein
MLQPPFLACSISQSIMWLPCPWPNRNQMSYHACRLGPTVPYWFSNASQSSGCHALGQMPWQCGENTFLGAMRGRQTDAHNARQTDRRAQRATGVSAAVSQPASFCLSTAQQRHQQTRHGRKRASLYVSSHKLCYPIYSLLIFFCKFMDENGQLLRGVCALKDRQPRLAIPSRLISWLDRPVCQMDQTLG